MMQLIRVTLGAVVCPNEHDRRFSRMVRAENWAKLPAAREVESRGTT